MALWRARRAAKRIGDFGTLRQRSQEMPSRSAGRLSDRALWVKKSAKGIKRATTRLSSAIPGSRAALRAASKPRPLAKGRAVKRAMKPTRQTKSDVLLWKIRSVPKGRTVWPIKNIKKTKAKWPVKGSARRAAGKLRARTGFSKASRNILGGIGRRRKRR